jgi:hypothetical protein
MSRTTLGTCTALAALAIGGLTMTATPAEADDHPFNPDCHLEAINQSLDSVIIQIRSSPAIGHAGGHYGKALEDIQRVKNQLHAGCYAWNKDKDKKLR